MELMTLSGILSWIPALRVMATRTYSLDTLPLGKPASKAVLRRELGLPVCNEVPLIGFIQHLDYQKGMDWLAGAMPWMMDQDLQLVMLGTGCKDLEDMLHHVEGCYFDKVCGWVGLSIRTAHHITAGADILLMPSCFEPCGLNQLYAMRYGTVLVVHSVGGLQEIVQPLDPFTASGMGWTFDRAEVGGFTDALKNAMWTYCDFKNNWIGIKEARNVTGSELGPCSSAV
jgi:starch synthase